MIDARGMVRNNDPKTSQSAAARLLPHLSHLEADLLAAIRGSIEGATDKELEHLPQFAHCGYGTVRRRRTSLRDKGYVVGTGDVRAGCQVWVARPIELVIADRQAQRDGCLF